MNLLLDTAPFLWIVAGSEELSDRARELFRDPGSRVYLSTVSCWEIAHKHAAGRLSLPDPPERFVPEMRRAHGIELLPVCEPAALLLGKLPPIHRDPFDRMLVSEAIEHGLTLLTRDPRIERYPVRTTW